MTHSSLIAILLTVSALLFSSCVTDFKPTPGVTVPENLQQAYVELDRMLTDEQKLSLRDGSTEVEEIVLTFGMQLKEYWGLWQDSKIAKFMRKRDVEHPDQMVAVIFEGYIDHLRSN